MLWNCRYCSCQGIAASVSICPMCEREREMPAVNKAGHSTIYGEPNEAQRAAAEAVSIATEEQPVVASEPVKPTPAKPALPTSDSPAGTVKLKAPKGA